MFRRSESQSTANSYCSSISICPQVRFTGGSATPSNKGRSLNRCIPGSSHGDTRPVLLLLGCIAVARISVPFRERAPVPEATTPTAATRASPVCLISLASNAAPSTDPRYFVVVFSLLFVSLCISAACLARRDSSCGLRQNAAAPTTRPSRSPCPSRRTLTSVQRERGHPTR